MLCRRRLSRVGPVSRRLPVGPRGGCRRRRPQTEPATATAAEEAGPSSELQQPDAKRQKRCCVFVGNSPAEIKQQQLRGLLAKCGRVASVNRPTGAKRQSGVAFVQFDSEEAVAHALQLNGSSLQGR